jgi:hypothetical protein
MIVNILGSSQNALVQSDFATQAFVCNIGGLLEPTIRKTGVLTGNGSTANPLGISGGTAGQVLTSNGAGQATFQASPAGGSFTAAGNSGPSQNIASGDTFSVLGSGVLTTVASATDTITASVVPSLVTGQVLTTTAGVVGWATPAAGSQTPLTVVDSTSIDLTASGVDNHTLTAVAKVSATAGNQVSINADGLFVPALAGLGVADTSCIDLTIAGTTLSAAPIIAPATGGRDNTLTCSPTGLFSPEVVFSTSNTCAAGGIGATFMVRSVTDIGLNQFRLDSAPEHTGRFNYQGASTTYNIFPLPAGTTNGTASPLLSITNPSACRTMNLLMTINWQQSLTLTPGSQKNSFGQISVNGGAFTTVISAFNHTNTSAVNQQTDFTLRSAVFNVPLAPGATYTIRARTIVTVVAGGIAFLSDSAEVNMIGWTI